MRVFVEMIFFDDFLKGKNVIFKHNSQGIREKYVPQMHLGNPFVLYIDSLSLSKKDVFLKLNQDVFLKLFTFPEHMKKVLQKMNFWNPKHGLSGTKEDIA